MHAQEILINRLNQKDVRALFIKGYDVREDKCLELSYLKTTTGTSHIYSYGNILPFTAITFL